jgi:PAS domain S-box-containing protein
MIGLGLLMALLLFGGWSYWYHRYRFRLLRKQVQRQSGYLASLLQNSIDAIIFIDNDNRVQLWNRGAELIFGYSAAEMLGKGFHRLVPPELNAEQELDDIRSTVYREGYISNYQTHRLTKDGRRLTVDLSRTLIYADDGKPIGSTAILRDVTEKVEMDKQLYNTEKLASIGILAAGVAHEINNPLAVILGFTDLLKERFAESTPERADLHVIEETANNVKRIVEDMLGFARVSEGLSDRVDVKQTLEKVLAMVQHTLVSSAIELVTDEVREGLPAVIGDPREYQQVLFNLINNSITAMSEGGGRLTVAAWPEEEFVHVRIFDTGRGIPDRSKSRVFDPFFTTKKVGEGTGLGLSLSYGIVRKYGGRIRFTSRSTEDHPDQPGRTAFTVSMPVVKSESSGVEGDGSTSPGS